VNNVETLALVPWIVRRGPGAFRSLGTTGSSGTKTFALAGKVARGGLVEVPMGTTLREIVEGAGGGVPGGMTLKAIQVGGPSGGCVPARLADTPVDYESLAAAGSLMGSGGMVVLDGTDCMVDLARYFLSFAREESCGKCTFCRIGTRRMLEILDDLCRGSAGKGHLAELERLAGSVGRGSLCGLGRNAPNPVVSTLLHFREEYEAHAEGRCPAKRCRALIRYAIREGCIGCTRCAQACPYGAIAMAPHRKHEVDDGACARCGACVAACPVGVVEVRGTHDPA
jgi:NADH-quinone oxidoreductase subunit F